MDQWRSKFSESFSLDRYWSIECSSLRYSGFRAQKTKNIFSVHLPQDKRSLKNLNTEVHTRGQKNHLAERSAPKMHTKICTAVEVRFYCYTQVSRSTRERETRGPDSATIHTETITSENLGTFLGSQHPSPNVKSLRNFEPQIWPEIIASRDAESTCFNLRLKDVM